MKAFLLPQAKIELQESYTWYENQEKGLGDEFLFSANTTKISLERNSEMYPKVFKDVRKASLQRFPYSLFYVVRSEKIFIIAVFHARRNPEQWRQRWFSRG